MLVRSTSIIFWLARPARTMAQRLARLEEDVHGMRGALGMDVSSVNIHYLLARYLRLFASGRKCGAMISGGQFVARMAR
nr:hypothetical protein [Tanacetum cinerariifolium]